MLQDSERVTPQFFDSSERLAKCSGQRQYYTYGISFQCKGQHGTHDKAKCEPILKAPGNMREDHPQVHSMPPDEGFSKDSKGYNGVSAVATATTCGHWKRLAS